MADVKSPLYPLLDEINRAAEQDFPFLAVAMTVALPDVCVSLISDDGRTCPERYKQWCIDNLGQEFSFVTPEDLYSMRCGVLHNGRFGDMKHNVARIIFALPGTPAFTDCRANDAYFYSVVEFCQNFTTAVRGWYEANKAHPNVQSNLPRLMQYHEGGFAPYVVGATVLG
jgi:hypothetical protein